jgi:hypothetical protein
MEYMGRSPEAFSSPKNLKGLHLVRTIRKEIVQKATKKQQQRKEEEEEAPRH